MPSGPGAFRGADVKIALWTSVSDTSVQGIGGFVGGVCCLLYSGGGGNIALLKSFALSLNSDAVSPSYFMIGVCCVLLGFAYLSTLKISCPFVSSRY